MPKNEHTEAELHKIASRERKKMRSPGQLLAEAIDGCKWECVNVMSLDQVGKSLTDGVVEMRCKVHRHLCPHGPQVVPFSISSEKLVAKSA